MMIFKIWSKMMAFQIFIFYAILNFHINLSVESCGVVSFRQHFCGVVSYRYHTTLLECLFRAISQHPMDLDSDPLHTSPEI